MSTAVISCCGSFAVFKPGKQVFNKMTFCVNTVIVRDLVFAASL